ncbi:hypothetical protein [Xanthomarina sp. GH4-25]|uniref:hypothetical protein n=1 Tax=Xanthomarina sp. GH4-25 TaxID=3349335 RepID=UPI0038780CFF
MMRFLIALFILSPFCSYAQEGKRFASNQKFYLNGNSTIIGNSIVGTDAIEPFNDDSEINDVLKMEYIDVDDDPSTFSSSQANLKLPDETSSIKYAALYWSAVYKYDKGVRRIINYEKMVYQGKDERSTNVNSILFKQPLGNYQPITGHVIYDSYETELFEDTKPYVCYADVTSLLKNSSTLNGTYAVANIKATEGYVSGGVAGGWLLYIIYEDETETAKYFTTYNGFVGVDKTATDIKFKDFKTDEIGDIKTSLLIGTLEGDQKYKTDNCSILDAEKKSFVLLSSNQRPGNNFFNSKITIEDEPFLDRNPNSTNTLGFDLLKMEIPNKNNNILSNNSSETTIRFKTKADGFYLFFVAFETEISPIYLEGKSNEETLVVFENEKPTEIVDIEIKEESAEILEPKSDVSKPVKVAQTSTPKPKRKTGLERIESLKSISIPNLAKGYYLVTNVFSVEENAMNWMKTLEEKGHTPKSYINPKNKWNYIYLANNEDASAIYQKQKELSKLDYFQDIWILKINF